jgi:arylformamidase
MDLDLLSADEREAQMNPRVAVPEAEAYLADFAQRSAEARARLEGRLDIAYGDTPLQALDVFAAAGGGGAPLHIFIHGGYWRALDKNANSFVAEGLVDAGATAVLLNYDLCPAVTLDDIVGQVRAAIAWIHGHAGDLGGDPNRIFISGHSAGAQLAMMALGHDWEADGLPSDLIKGAVGVSGVYDLLPVLKISVNDDVRLSEDMAARNSPTRHPPATSAPLVVAVGQQETPAFVAQSKDFHQTCVNAGLDSRYLECPGDDHFSVLYTLANPISSLCGLVLRQMSLA